MVTGTCQPVSLPISGQTDVYVPDVRGSFEGAGWNGITYFFRLPGNAAEHSYYTSTHIFWWKLFLACISRKQIHSWSIVSVGDFPFIFNKVMMIFWNSCSSIRFGRTSSTTSSTKYSQNRQYQPLALRWEMDQRRIFLLLKKGKYDPLYVGGRRRVDLSYGWMNSLAHAMPHVFLCWCVFVCVYGYLG